MNEQGVTLQTVILSSLLALAAVGVGIVIFNVISDESGEISEVSEVLDDFCAEQTLIITDECGGSDGGGETVIPGEDPDEDTPVDCTDAPPITAISPELELEYEYGFQRVSGTGEIEDSLSFGNFEPAFSMESGGGSDVPQLLEVDADARQALKDGTCTLSFTVSNLVGTPNEVSLSYSNVVTEEGSQSSISVDIPRDQEPDTPYEAARFGYSFDFTASLKNADDIEQSTASGRITYNLDPAFYISGGIPIVDEYVPTEEYLESLLHIGIVERDLYDHYVYSLPELLTDAKFIESNLEDIFPESSAYRYHFATSDISDPSTLISYDLINDNAIRIQVTDEAELADPYYKFQFDLTASIQNIERTNVPIPIVEDSRRMKFEGKTRFGFKEINAYPPNFHIPSAQDFFDTYFDRENEFIPPIYDDVEVGFITAIGGASATHCRLPFMFYFVGIPRLGDPMGEFPETSENFMEILVLRDVCRIDPRFTYEIKFSTRIFCLNRLDVNGEKQCETIGEPAEHSLIYKGRKTTTLEIADFSYSDEDEPTFSYEELISRVTSNIEETYPDSDPESPDYFYRFTTSNPTENINIRTNPSEVSNLIEATDQTIEITLSESANLSENPFTYSFDLKAEIVLVNGTVLATDIARVTYSKTS